MPYSRLTSLIIQQLLANVTGMEPLEREDYARFD
jgi:hypothetical protein